MPMVAQPLCELPEPRKMDYRVVAVRAKTRWQVLAVQAMVVRPLVTAWYAKGLCPIGQSRGSSSQVVAKSSESGVPVFMSLDVLLYGLNLWDGQFLNRKKCATISVVLNYRCMGPSQPTSSDTVSLRSVWIRRGEGEPSSETGFFTRDDMNIITTESAFIISKNSFKVRAGGPVCLFFSIERN
jgi:hypothetical protein